MKTFSADIKMNRGEQQFLSNIVIVKGDLNTLNDQLNRLHPREAIRYAGYKYDRRKASYLIGRLSAKQAIINLTSIVDPKSIWTDSGVFEFPVVKCSQAGNIQVSISHCEDIGISIAFPEVHPMAVDIEKIDASNEKVLLGQMTENEKILLKKTALNNILGYTILWNAKEALSKVIRTGMMIDFKLLEVTSISKEDGVLDLRYTHFGQYKTFVFADREYVISVVLPGKTMANISRLSGMFDAL